MDNSVCLPGLTADTHGRPPEDATDEQLYAWFVRDVDGREVAENVIEVPLHRGHGRQETVWLHITREQLRTRAWAEYNIFDDTDFPAPPPRTTTPVADGMDEFSLGTEVALGALGRRGRRHLHFGERGWEWSD